MGSRGFGIRASRCEDQESEAAKAKVLEHQTTCFEAYGRADLLSAHREPDPGRGHADRAPARFNGAVGYADTGAPDSPGRGPHRVAGPAPLRPALP